MNDAGSHFIRFGRETCGNLGQAERREWWLANGLGAYASGTVAGTLTRRYHGLLIAPLEPPLGRFLVFAKADALLLEDDREWPLASNRWGDGTIIPQGHQHIESFHLDGRMPVWHFAFGDLRLELRVWLEPGAHTVYLAYRPLFSDKSRERQLSLNVRLLINARDHHGNAASWRFQPLIEPDGAGLSVRGAAVAERHLPFTLRFQARGGRIIPEHTWYENFDLPLERERGLPDRDQHLCVGQALIELDPGEWSGLVASLHDNASPYLEEAMRRAHAQDRAILTRARVQVPEMREAPAWIEQLLLAADSFVFARPLADVPEGESVIAGYPWFGDWGRDTMIALPGLTLATGRYESARRILETFARFIDRGMLPNVFPGSGEAPEYNTADAALWYVEAWRAYVETTGDKAALRIVFPVLAGIIDAYSRGTRYGIAMDPGDGLLRAGEPGVQITWMDAKVGDWVVTPRIGKPVEINALWFNALKVMAEFAGWLQQPSAPYLEAAERVRKAFRRFVRPQTDGLYDVLDGPEGDDRAVRPNQIFAVSLPHSPLTEEEQRGVVGRCGRELLTSYGLRSLTPADPAFTPQYLGGVSQRDGAYHLGPAWAWLLGHYALAAYRVYGDAEAALSVLEPIRDHLLDAGLGTVSEIFDGAAPHTPRGAPSQAWSVACVLEAWWKLRRANNRAIARESGGSAEPPSAAATSPNPTGAGPSVL
jgi:predicted glycogen debranching enzyme